MHICHSITWASSTHWIFTKRIENFLFRFWALILGMPAHTICDMLSCNSSWIIHLIFFCTEIYNFHGPYFLAWCYELGTNFGIVKVCHKSVQNVAIIFIYSFPEKYMKGITIQINLKAISSPTRYINFTHNNVLPIWKSILYTQYCNPLFSMTLSK